jgi:hypothetical protein
MVKKEAFIKLKLVEGLVQLLNYSPILEAVCVDFELVNDNV